MLNNIFASASKVLATARTLRPDSRFPFIKAAPPDWPDLLPEKIHPVIVVPGLLGTWPPNRRGKLDPITGLYINLVNGLTRIGYVPGVSLFTFAYDWRKGASDLAPLLAAEVARIRAMSPQKALGRSPRPVDYSRVDLICHSMGGVVGRAYIQSGDHAGEVNRLVLVASPQLGSMSAYYAYEGGDSTRIGVPVNDARSMVVLAEAFDTWQPFRRFGSIIRGIRGKNLPDLYQYIRSGIPSIRDFLPVKQTNYLYIEDESGEEKLYPFGLPENPLVESLDKPENLDKLDALAEISCFYSTTVQTLTRLLLEKPPNPPLYQHGQPVNPQPATSYGPGDSIVPHFSAHLELPPTKTDGSAWQVKVNHTDLGKQLNRSLDHVQIVGDPDSVRSLLQSFLRPDLPPLEATTWDGPKLSARKPNYAALVLHI